MEFQSDKSSSVSPMPVDDPFMTRPIDQTIPHSASSKHLEAWSRISSRPASPMFFVPEHPPQSYSPCIIVQSPTRKTPVFNVPVYASPDTTMRSQSPAPTRTISGPPGSYYKESPCLQPRYETQLTYGFPFPLQTSPSARRPLTDIKNIGTPRRLADIKTSFVEDIILASSPSPITPPRSRRSLKRAVSSPATLKPNKGPLSFPNQTHAVYRLGFSSRTLTGNAPFGLFRLRLALPDANARARSLAQECCGEGERMLLDEVGEDGQETWVVKRRVQNKRWEVRLDDWEVVVRVVVYAWEGD